MIPVVFLIVAFGVTILPVFLASRYKKLKRRQYAVRTVPLMGLLVAVNMFMGLLGDLITLSIAAALLMAAAVFHVIWSVHRTNDAGLSRWWNFLVPVPVVNLFWWAYLLSRESAAEEPGVDIFD